jgi:hypothetical protein
VSCQHPDTLKRESRSHLFGKSLIEPEYRIDDVFGGPRTDLELLVVDGHPSRSGKAAPGNQEALVGILG